MASLHFDGERQLPHSPAVVSSKLGDARFLVQCIPGVESISRSEPATAVCILRPGFAFMRGTLEVTLTIAETVPETSVRVLVQSKGIGSGSEAEATLALSPKDGGTQVRWSTDVTRLTGLLRAAPQGLIKAAAQKVIEDLWVELEKRLAG